MQLGNFLTFTNHSVVSSSRAEMSKKNEEFKMSGTSYPMMQCHIPDKQILQVSVLS
jgi:hypothetical protein